MIESVNPAERLKRVVENDLGGEIVDSLRVAQSDLVSVLAEFMDVRKLDMRVSGIPDGYRLVITVDANRIYTVGKLERE